MVLLTLLACGPSDGVLAEFEDARKEATHDLVALPTDWTPDARVRLSRRMLDDLIGAALQDTPPLSRRIPLPMGSTTPSVSVTSVELEAPHRTCRTEDSCFAVKMDLAGQLVWTSPLGNGSAPLTASLSVDVQAHVVKQGDLFALQLRPTDVRRAVVTFDGASRALSRAADGPLEAWLDESIAALPPYDVTTFGEGLPLRAVRLGPSKEGLVVELATSFADRSSPLPNLPMPRTGFDLALDHQTVTRFTARQAFENGPGPYNILATPTALILDGNQMALSLRLWGGSAWYRDYDVKGALTLRDGELSVVANEAVERAHSEGAAEADPLAYAVSGAVPTALQTVLNLTLPALDERTAKTRRITTRLTRLKGQEGAIVVDGEVTLARRGRPGGRPGGKPRPRP